tara:strand:- start:4339 stop:4821 length:483 start_codon:yes stop_codon:yes gene_type:complete
MGRRGTKPTPTNVLKLRGSWRGEINKNEPQPEAVAPPMPIGLDGMAKDCWEQLVPILSDMRVLTVADGMALYLLAETYATWRRADDMIKKDGDVYPINDNEGNVKYMQQSPYVSIARNSAKALKDLLCEFGLTPSARSRVQTTSDNQSKQQDERMKYLGG